VRAAVLGASDVDRYKAARRAETYRGKQIGDTTIARELEVLSAALHYAVKRRQLLALPFIEKPNEDNVREVEVPLDAFPKLLVEVGRLCTDVRDLVEWLFLTGTRPKGARELRWEWFDQKTWTLRVPAEKGGSAREFAVEESLRPVIERRLFSRLSCPFVFSHRGRQHRQDRDRRVFFEALRACGLGTGKVGGFTLYDIKKTAIGLMLDSGLSDVEAMDFSGHKTTAMLHRYRNKTRERHAASVRKRDEYLAKKLAHS
jgi:integrase